MKCIPIYIYCMYACRKKRRKKTAVVQIPYGTYSCILNIN